MDLAPALAEKRFYHVACRQDLENISEQGLVPSGVSGRERNFGEYDIDPECVYLWPSIGNAQAYAYEHPERFVGSARIIFQVEAPGAYESLCPDQEDLARHWEDFESEYPEEVLTRAQNELGDVAPPLGEKPTFAQSAEMIRKLSTETRLLLANYCALRGDALMVRGSIPVAELALAELNDIESLQERFSEEHPELNPYDNEDDESGEREEAYYQAMDEWMLEQLGGGECVDENELKEQLQDPSELVENLELRYYNLRPLAEL
jgi:hypothetical protein